MLRFSCFLASFILISSLCSCLRTAQPMDSSDAAVKSRLVSALKSQPGLNLRFVTVDVTDGVVTLSGMVDSFREKNLVDRIARGTKGVDQVLVNLIVPE